MNLKKIFSFGLSLITVGSAISALGQSAIIEQARFGASTGGTNNTDFAFNGFTSTITGNHSTAPGLVTGYSTSSRIDATGNPGNPGTNVVISPNGGDATISNTETSGTLQIGTTYLVSVSFAGSPTAASPDIVVSDSDTGMSGIDTFNGTTSTAFQSGSGYNKWNAIGYITPGTANPTITFSYSAGVSGRWNVDSILFSPVPPPPSGTYQYWDTGSAGGSGSWTASATHWNTLASGAGTQEAYTQADLSDFGGTAGTVTIDPVNGITTDGGLEFDVNNYVITGGTLALGSSPSTSGTNIAVAPGTTATINSVISGSYGLCNAYLGTLNLGAVNNFTGTVTLQYGTLHLNPNTSQSFSSLAGGGALALGANTLTVGSDNSSTTYSGVLSDGGAATPGALIKTGTGTLTLSGASTFYGPTTVNQGVLSISGDGALGTAPSTLVTNQLTLNNATLNFPSGPTFNAKRGITLIGNDTATMVGGVSPSFNSPITGSGSLTVIGGSPNFNATNTFAGGLTFTTVSNTSVRFNTNNSGGTGTITVNPQAAQPCTMRNDIAGIRTTITNPLVLNTGGANLNIDTGPTNGSTNSIFTLSGNITGTAASVSINDQNTGLGTVVLSGNNSGFPGGFDLAGGTLALGSPTCLGTGTLEVEAEPSHNTPTSPNPTFALQAAVVLTGANAVTNAVYIDQDVGFILNGTNSFELSGPVTMNQTSVNFEVDNTAPTIISGSISDGGNNLGLSLTSTNSGVLVLKGSNSYTYSTVISSGTLEAAGSNSIPAGPVFIIGGTLQLDTPYAMSPACIVDCTSGTINLNFTGYQTISSLNNNTGPATYGANTPNNLGITFTGPGYLNVVPLPGPFSITSQYLDATGTNFVVCWTSVPGQNYDVLTNTSLAGTGAWVSAGSTNATDTTTCFTLPGGITGKRSVFVQIQAP